MNRYPTEEELNQLIEALETQELYAPWNLKEQILKQIPEGLNETKSAQRKTEKPESSRIHKSVQFFSYSAKIVAGMAAAIAMLILFPMQNSQAKGADRIAQKEQQHVEEYTKWEMENRQRKAREKAWENGTDQAEQKIENIWNGFCSIWNREMEEN